MERAIGFLGPRSQRPLSLASWHSITHSVTLPTALANPADQYIILPACTPFSPLEFARAFSVPPTSPLWAMLSSSLLTPCTITSSFGRAVHPSSLVLLFEHFHLSSHLTAGHIRYGSAFSGLDVGAVALDHLFPGRWCYVFASESRRLLRSALVASWSPRGLLASSVHSDTRSTTSAPPVDIYLITSPCGDYSSRNRHRSSAAIARSLAVLSDSLEYVRQRRPSIVILENVPDSEDHVNAMLITCSPCAQMPRVTLKAVVDASVVEEWLVEVVQFYPLADDGWEAFEASPVSMRAHAIRCLPFSSPLARPQYVHREALSWERWPPITTPPA